MTVKIPIRFWLPVLAALLIIIGLGVFFLRQIQLSVRAIERPATERPLSASSLAADPLLEDLPDDATSLGLLRKGELLLLQGDLKEAEEAFSESAENGGGIPALRHLLQVQLQRRHFDDAENTLDDLENEGAQPADLLLYEGRIALQSGDVKRARSIFSGTENTPEGSYGLALIAIITGDHDGAKTLLRTATQGSSPLVRTQAQSILDAYGEFELFESGQNIHLVTLLSRALAQVQECELALPLVSRVAAERNDYRDAWIVKGFCELTSERYQESLLSLEQAYNIDPEKPETQYFLARAYYALGDPQNAVTFLEYAILNGFRPESDARNLLARYARELGQPDLALEQYRALAERPESDTVPFERFIALALTLPDHAEEAYQMAKAASSKWPNDIDVSLLLARTEIATERKGEAKARLEEILRLEPTNKEATELMKTTSE